MFPSVPVLRSICCGMGKRKAWQVRLEGCDDGEGGAGKLKRECTKGVGYETKLSWVFFQINFLGNLKQNFEHLGKNNIQEMIWYLQCEQFQWIIHMACGECLFISWWIEIESSRAELLWLFLLTAMVPVNRLTLPLLLFRLQCVHAPKVNPSETKHDPVSVMHFCLSCIKCHIEKMCSRSNSFADLNYQCRAHSVF